MTDQQVRDLTRTIEGLATDAALLRDGVLRLGVDMRRSVHGIRLFAAGALLVIASVIACGYYLSWSNHEQIAANNRKLCPIVGLLVQQPGQAVPPTERARLITVRAAVLSQDLGCAAP